MVAYTPGLAVGRQRQWQVQGLFKIENQQNLVSGEVGFGGQG